MTKIQTENLDIDTRLLADFIYALNIARRQVLAYPAGHPMVVKATENLVRQLPKLLEFRSSITLGVARDKLMLDGVVIDPENPVYKDLASSLFEMRIASLTINRELTSNEIVSFFDCFREAPEKMNMQEEIDSILLARGFKGIRVQGIDFSAFSTTEVDIVHAPELKGLESDTSRLWRSFAKGIIKGSIDPNGELPQSLEEIDPDILAQVMNQQFEDTGVSSEASYEQAITSFLQKSDQENIRDQAHQESIGRLGSLVGKLKPEIRRQFLNSTFKSCANRPGTAENLLSHMPREVLLDALDQVDAGSIEIPQSLLDVVGKLSKHGADGVSTSRVAGNVGRSTQETAQQLASLFSEDRSEFFVPKDYQDALAAMTAATADQFLTDGQVDELVSSLDTHAVEKQFCNVLLDLLERDVPLEIGDAIGRNLLAIMDYFLETGDFVSLARVHNSLTRHVLTLPEGVSESSHEALAYFSSEDFIDRVLDSFEVWGEPSQSAINSLVREAGHLFADAMLERLADEPKMARRRHYMELLVRVGAAVIEPIEERSDDSRWYFVRNMVLILRALKDPAAIKVLRGLTKHENAKVRIEVVKSLLELRDEQGHRVLYEALMDKDPLVLSGAVQLAALSSDKRIMEAMAKLLNKKLPTEHAVEIKSQVINNLINNATDVVLPELTKFFKGKKLFVDGRAHELKISAVPILAKIGTVDAGILAGEVAQSSSGELAEVAEEVLVKIHGALT